MLYPSPSPPMAPESKRKLMGMLESPPETSVFSSQARINKWLPWQRPFVILPVFPLVWLALNPRFLSYFISFYAFICLFIIYTFVTFISFPLFMDRFQHTWPFWSLAFAWRVSLNIDVMLGVHVVCPCLYVAGLTLYVGWSSHHVGVALILFCATFFLFFSTVWLSVLCEAVWMVCCNLTLWPLYFGFDLSWPL